MNRLITAQSSSFAAEEKQPAYKRDYNYDATGNILEKSDIGSYQYNNPKQPMAVTNIADTDYRHDNNGNLINDGIWQYEWNENNYLWIH